MSVLVVLMLSTEMSDDSPSMFARPLSVGKSSFPV